jgi:methylmalonyl-CoA epimerase
MERIRWCALGIHHICLEVDNLAAMLAEMKAKGVKLINETPTLGAGGKQIAFIHPSSANGVLVELFIIVGIAGAINYGY